MARLRDGDRIGPFVVEGCIGQGQFGITYLARHRELGMKAAIKEFFPSSLARRSEDGTVSAADKPSSVQFGKERGEFLAEAQAIARFGDHPNIVKVKDFIAANGTSYIVMEWLDGETIAEKVGSRRGGDLQPYTVEALKPILLQLLDALETLHAAKPPLLHRDIKPANIIISNKTGAPVLIDFGAARQVSADRSQNLTAILTHGYAPYEQYTMDEDDLEQAFGVSSSRRKALPPQGPHTDIYALGAVCYFALTGTRPPDSVVRRWGNATYHPLEKRVSGAPAVLRSIDRALAVEPKDRFGSAGEWRDAIGPETARLTPPPPSPPKRRGALIGALAGSVLILWIFLYMIAARGGGGTESTGDGAGRSGGAEPEGGLGASGTPDPEPGATGEQSAASPTTGTGTASPSAITTAELDAAIDAAKQATPAATQRTITLSNRRASRLNVLHFASEAEARRNIWTDNIVEWPIGPGQTGDFPIWVGGKYGCEFRFRGTWEDGTPLDDLKTNLCIDSVVTLNTVTH